MAEQRRVDPDFNASIFEQEHYASFTNRLSDTKEGAASPLQVKKRAEALFFEVLVILAELLGRGLRDQF